jgi:hypothetical protein
MSSPAMHVVGLDRACAVHCVPRLEHEVNDDGQDHEHDGERQEPRADVDVGAS